MPPAASANVFTRFERRASVIILRLSRAVPSDAVILIPANVCPVVPLALLSARRKFEFVDLDPMTLSMDLGAVEVRLRRPSPRVGAVLYVRSYGYRDDLSDAFGRLRNLAPDTLLIDDRCAGVPELDAVSTDLQGAHVAVYSTGYAKYVDLGIGGFAHITAGVGYDEAPLIARPKALERATTILQRHVRSQRPIYTGDPEGHELLQYLEWLDGRPPNNPWTVHRSAVDVALEPVGRHKAEKNEVYRARIPRSWQLDVPDHPWRFTIRVPDRDRLLADIRAAGFIASDHYFPASTLFGDHRAPVAESLYRVVLNLFNDRYIDLNEVRAVAEIVAHHEHDMGD